MFWVLVRELTSIFILPELPLSPTPIPPRSQIPFFSQLSAAADTVMLKSWLNSVKAVFPQLTETNESRDLAINFRLSHGTWF